jgi:hypothetical protein
MYRLNLSKKDVEKFFSEPFHSSHKGLIEPEKIKPEFEETPEPPLAEEPVTTVAEEPVTTVVEEPVTTVAEEPVVEQPVEEQPVVEQPVVEQPVVEEPVVEEPIVEEPVTTVAEEPIVEEPVVEEPVTTVAEEPVVEEPVMEEPVVEEEEEVHEEIATPIDEIDEVVTTLYDYDGESYYLDNAQFLQRTFDLPDGQYPVQLCISTCVRNGCMPYLLYLTVYNKNTGTLGFPSTANVLEITETDTDSDVQEKLMTEFKESLFDIYPPNESRPLSMEDETPTDVYNPNLFKGFFWNKEDNRLLMVYDATRVNIPLNDDKEYFWVTPYEILILNQMRNLKIDTTVTTLFKTIAISSGYIDTSFYQLKRESDKTVVPSPYVLFICSHNSGTSGGLFNLFSTRTTFENILQEDADHVSLLCPTVNDSRLGDFPIFSSLPLDPNSPPIKRYAAFVDIDDLQPFFIDESNKDELEHLYYMKNENQYSSICFFKESVQLWCIKSPLYFTEIYDDLRKNIPISSFRETTEIISSSKGPKEGKEGSIVLSNDDGDEVSDEGEEVASNEGEEVASNEGDETASNEGDSKVEEGEKSKEDENKDEYTRGYEEGYKEAIQKAQNAVTGIK